jgi:hypothetical protein
MTTDPNPPDRQAKYTVMLTPRSIAALKAAADNNHETRTNVINRGIQLYRLVTEAINADATIIIRDLDGNERVVELL